MGRRGTVRNSEGQRASGTASAAAGRKHHDDTRQQGLAVEQEALDVLRPKGVAINACDKEAFR